MDNFELKIEDTIETPAEQNGNKENIKNIDNSQMYKDNESGLKNDYGFCLACGGLKSDTNWCPPCHSKLLLEENSGWTSDYKGLDDFIKETIIHARRSYDYLEWIPFENFKDIKKIGQGGFATVYSAIRTNCLKGHFEWDEKAKKYVRKSWGDYRVALKSFRNVSGIAETFLNEIKTHHKCMMLQDDEFLQCYGISRNPKTREFITVLDYAQQGDLRSFLQRNHDTLNWEDRLKFATKVVKDLKIIHESGLVHCDFHSGNVLQVTKNSRVSDFGLSRLDKDYIPKDEGCFGVIPYMAPEVLNGKPYRQPADVYSYGMIMWEISTGRPAFCNIPHDYQLIIQICEGRRPPIAGGTPPCYIELMQRCWNQDPTKRPTTKEIYETCLEWYNCVKERKDESSIYQQFAKADEMPPTIDEAVTVTSPEAVYASRFINYVTLQYDFVI
ncbi:hypothetical protein Glove_551g63 [Diversispora epigaea]|uniref:Protein kinase domain-containing protein n=1 Tax=Diversispora epigaea TaxID=1348612 RepID=A0A397GDD1_9GLOM|nr:hypothetical protein Glove_551g63 [Diversispora epigaea]